MKRTIRYVILFLLLTLMFATSLIHASPDLIGISNLTFGDQKAGTFEIKGVILNDGQISRVAVKVGIGPWENAVGVERFNYQLNTRQIVLNYENEIPIYGPYYGNLDILIGAFNVNGDKLSEKAISIMVIPEKPSSDLISGVYLEPVNVVLHTAPEVTAYYTIDGTDPKTNGTSYSGAIYVNQNTVLKAVTKSANNQYSEITTLDLKIDNLNPPWFMVQYYEDQAFSRPLPDPAHLKAGTYYLKIVSDRKFSGNPLINIDAPGSTNDVINASLTPVSDCVFRYTRTVSEDVAADGYTRETITISGTDIHGNPVQNLAPTNVTAKAAYLDTQTPVRGLIWLDGYITATNDPTPLLDIDYTTADWMRLALSESALSTAPWVEYALQYDEFDISSGGIGNKYIWVEFKDQAGNIQTQQHSFAVVSYNNAITSYDIEYYRDSNLTQSLGNNPYLKEGTYYLKITANQDLSFTPSLQIDAEGSNNDVISGLTVMFNPRIYYYTRTITTDSAAVGATREQITIQGINPSNADIKAAYTDTQAPDIPVVSGPATTFDLKPAWTWTSVSSAIKYRYSFTDGSNWAETTAISYTPADNLTAGNSYTLYVQAVDQAGNWSASGSFTVTINTTPEINVKQGTVDIPSGTGSFNFGDVSVFSFRNTTFTVENTGADNLNLTGSPIVQISGTDASCFSVTAQPSSPVAVAGSSTFVVKFTPNSLGTKTASISIANSDLDENPYTFTITGNGTVQALTLNTWTPGNIPAPGEVMTYAVGVTPWKRYGIAWDDSYQGSGAYNCDVRVTAYRQDLTTTYFSGVNSGYSAPQIITALENMIYIKVEAYSSATGSFALKPFLDESEINIKQGANNIPNGGSYNFGDVPLGTFNYVTFTIENNGSGNLDLTGSPRVQISGTGASSFITWSQPDTPVAPNGSTTFEIKFIPTSADTKTATITIANNDADRTPFTFTISGTGTNEIDTLTPDTWTTGNLSNYREGKAYRFDATPGKTYSISWDDSVQGSGTYTGQIQVAAYKEDFTSAYFSYTYSGYTTPRYIVAQENTVYLRAVALNTATGSFAMKVSEVIPIPAINIRQGSTNLPNGTGNYNFGHIWMGSNKTVSFTVQNTGTADLSLTGSPRVQISGADAACFVVTSSPAATIGLNGYSSFQIRFSTRDSVTKTATVSIQNNVPDMSPYTFTITGAGDSLPLGAWTSGYINFGEAKIYGFNAIPGATYSVAWDEKYSGSGAYTCDVKVSAFRQDMTTTYFSNINSAYTSPRIITALDNVVFLKVEGYFTSFYGSYALKVANHDPIISVMQGTTDLPNGTGIYNFGSCAIGSPTSVTFTVKNTGVYNLNLTGDPRVQISGTDASCFMVTSQPSTTVYPNGSNNFTIRFTPNSPDPKTATVSIANNDQDQNPYTFTITGTGTGTLESLPFDTWTSGNITAGETKYYSFNATIGQDYSINWDDQFQGSGAYTANIYVSAYRQDFNTTYFTSAYASYTSPRCITALENIVYLKVYTYSSSGSYALKVYPSAPKINIKQGTENVPNGTGSYNFGNVLLCTTGYLDFTIENTGVGDLRLTGGGSGIQISGPDAGSFCITSLPATTIGPNQSSSFTVGFNATSKETKTATITITSNDTYNNSSYTFTVTGTGTGEFEPISLDTTTTGNLAQDEVKLYSFSTVPGATYAITWDDFLEGSGTKTGDIFVTAYRQDLSTVYFTNNSGFYNPKIITAQENTVYLKVAAYSTGSFSIKPFVPLNEAKINVSQGTIDIPNGTGSYDFETVSFCTSGNATFIIQNTGLPYLHLTGNPFVQISGPDASYFTVTSQPASTLTECQATPFTVRFTPTDAQTRTATVTIFNDDVDQNPYTFTITGRGGAIELTLNTWMDGNFPVWDEKTYCFNTIPGKRYGIMWRDDWSGLPYTATISVTGYRQDISTTYFGPISFGPQYLTALDNVVYIKVSCVYSGLYALKAFLDEPVMNLKQGTTDIPNGGSYDFGTVPLGPGNTVTFTIENAGIGNLNLTDAPKVRISGTDASSFRVSSDPPTTIAGNENATFNINCEPTSTGIKTATISIANNDPAGNPYTFTITGTGTLDGTLTPDTWTTGNISPGERKTYCLNAIQGRTYAITWDDSISGSGTYTGDIMVSAYRQDIATNYFIDMDNGYSIVQAISTQDNFVYITVKGKNPSSSGSFALKAYLYEPVMSIKSGGILIPNVTGSYNFGDVSLCSYHERDFYLYNDGNAPLQFISYPYVLISGPDASQFRVSSQPFPSVTPGLCGGFDIEFAPTSIGPKTATITIANNDPDQTPYTFTVTGNGFGTFIPATLENWITSSLGNGEEKLYSFNVTPGTAYAIHWDDINGSGNYYSNIVVSAFRPDLTTTYFRDVNFGYTYPQVIIAQDNIVHVKVTTYAGGCQGTYALLVSLSNPVINVKQYTTNIPCGTGSYNYGPVTINTESSTYFTVENIGDGALHLTGNPPVLINGPDASSFNLYSQPYSPINIHDSSGVTIKFIPTSTGTKTATVSIGSDDTMHSPYTFTITGYGAPAIEKSLTFGSWTEGNIAAAGEEKYYSFNATAGKKYVIVWDDSAQGSGVYTGDIKVTAFRSDFLTPYFTDINNGYAPPQFVTTQDTKIYLKVSGINPSATGSFALRIAESLINVKQNSVNIPNGSGNYDFGSVALDSDSNVTFIIENTGSVNLNLIGSFPVQISGTDASCFSVISQPYSPILWGGSRAFSITFTPTGVGTKTATVSIFSDDLYSNPYTFTITGTVSATNISLDTWTPGALNSGQVKTYYFNTIPGTVYGIVWDDSYQGSGAYTCNIKVSAYRQDYSTPYFSNVNSGYTSCQSITAQDSIVYLKVEGYDTNSTGTFALKPFIGFPVINLKQGGGNIPNGSSYGFGNVTTGSSSSVTFTVQNTGAAALNLTGSPKVQISGTDASLFTVSTQPNSPIACNGSANFTVRFAPITYGVKTATVSIVSDDNANNPYTFTINGTGTPVGIPLTLGAWTSGSLTSAGEVKTYNFTATPGASYTIAWDDGYEGSGIYTCDIKVSAYREDLTTTYFSNYDSGWAPPITITAQDSIVYLKVSGYSSSYTGSFALKPTLVQPVINLKQGSTNIPNGTGSFNYGSVAPSSSSSVTFTIQNTGNGSLNLTASPIIQINGTDASLFTVTSQPYSPVSPNGGSTTFTLRFAPTSLGAKTASVSIASNDTNIPTYSFTVTGTGSNTGEEITLGTYLPKNIGVGETKTYWFSAVPGRTYRIYWDDSYQGSGTYNCDIKVAGFRQNLTTTYFSYTDSAYTTPQTITAQENIVYLIVTGYYSYSTGTFALKAVEN